MFFLLLCPHVSPSVSQSVSPSGCRGPYECDWPVPVYASRISQFENTWEGSHSTSTRLGVCVTDFSIRDARQGLHSTSKVWLSSHCLRPGILASWAVSTVRVIWAITVYFLETSLHCSTRLPCAWRVSTKRVCTEQAAEHGLAAGRRPREGLHLKYGQEPERGSVATLAREPPRRVRFDETSGRSQALAEALGCTLHTWRKAFQRDLCRATSPQVPCARRSCLPRRSSVLSFELFWYHPKREVEAAAINTFLSVFTFAV